MRVTVCETPHDPTLLESAWARLCSHCRDEGTELLVLPEFAFLEPVWQLEAFDPHKWSALDAAARSWISRLTELGCSYVIGAMPVTVAGSPYNQGFIWSSSSGLAPLRSKRYLPEETGGWEARWFTRGHEAFPVFSAGEIRFGLNICTELWALETFGPYARAGAHAVVSPRATAAATTERWTALARTIAVRTGAFSLSSNRWHADGSCGGAGWIIDPEGNELARTSQSNPAVTLDIDLAASEQAQSRYPRYVFADA